MSPARVDGGFHAHPKTAQLVNRRDPLNVWVRLLSWTRNFKTSGHVPHAVARKFGTDKALQRLVETALFDITDTGYSFHDYAHHNDLGAARSEAGRRGAAARWKSPREQTGFAKVDSNLFHDLDTARAAPGGE